MKYLTFTILILSLILSCTNKKFDSEKWKPYESGVIDEKYRSKMVYDLVYNVLKVNHRDGESSTYKEVVELIGEPESIDTINGFVEFLLEEKYGWNIDPNGYKHLQLYFDKDSLLQKWIIVDTEFEP